LLILTSHPAVGISGIEQFRRRWRIALSVAFLQVPMGASPLFSFRTTPL
jgi:hypothetical protein